MVSLLCSDIVWIYCLVAQLRQAGGKQVLVLVFCGPTCIPWSYMYSSKERRRHPAKEKMVPGVFPGSYLT